MTGRGDELHEPRLAHLEARSSDDVYLYGWPSVVLADRDGVLRVAPLLITTLEASSGADGAFVAVSTRPHLNPMLMSRGLVPRESGVAASAAPRRSSEWFGDVTATVTLVEELCEQMGLELHGCLDPDRLAPPEREEGVHNTAVGLLTRHNLPPASCSRSWRSSPGAATGVRPPPPGSLTSSRSWPISCCAPPLVAAPRGSTPVRRPRSRKPPAHR